MLHFKGRKQQGGMVMYEMMEFVDVEEVVDRHLLQLSQNAVQRDEVIQSINCSNSQNIDEYLPHGMLIVFVVFAIQISQHVVNLDRRQLARRVFVVQVEGEHLQRGLCQSTIIPQG